MSADKRTREANGQLTRCFSEEVVTEGIPNLIDELCAEEVVSYSPLMDAEGLAGDKEESEAVSAVFPDLSAAGYASETLVRETQQMGSSPRGVSRRRLLRLIGAGVITGVVGCSQQQGNQPPTAARTPSQTPTNTPKPTTGTATDFDDAESGAIVDVSDHPQSWGMFGANAAHTRALPGATGPDPPIEIRWRFDGATDRAYPAAATNDTVYVGSDDSNVYAIDAATGKERWRFEPETGYTHPTAVVNDTLYVGLVNSETNLYALDAATGTEKWRATASSDRGVGPAVLGEVVVVASGPDSGTVVAFDATTGEERWRFETPADETFQPTVAQETVYVGSGDTNLYAVNAATGEERWRFEEASTPTSPPAVVDDVVYLGSRDGTVYALEEATGEERWRFAEPRGSTSPPAVVRNTVHFGTTDGSVYGLDASEGNVRWRFDFTDGEPRRNWPAVVNDTVYIGGFDSNVYALDAATGEERWRFEPDTGLRTYSVVMEETLYIGSERGDNAVYALT